jgi:hypothetical protein
MGPIWPVKGLLTAYRGATSRAKSRVTIAASGMAQIRV